MVGVLEGFATIAIIVAVGWLLADRRVLDDSAQVNLSRLAFHVDKGFDGVRIGKIDGSARHGVAFTEHAHLATRIDFEVTGQDRMIVRAEQVQSGAG